MGKEMLSEKLDGEELKLAVAFALGFSPLQDSVWVKKENPGETLNILSFDPVNDARQANVIMESEKIGVDRPMGGQKVPLWRGIMDDHTDRVRWDLRGPAVAYAPTLLMAAMRCKVVCAFGPTLPVDVARSIRGLISRKKRVAVFAHPPIGSDEWYNSLDAGMVVEAHHLVASRIAVEVYDNTDAGCRQWSVVFVQTEFWADSFDEAAAAEKFASAWNSKIAAAPTPA